MVECLEYGLVGKNISHSFSADYFNRKFSKENIEAVYKPFDLPDIEKIKEIIQSRPYLKGLNVTSPYKRDIIPYLDSLTMDAQELSAVNVVKISRDNGKVSLKGHNVDWLGFYNTLESLRLPQNLRALILGTGGAASAIAYALSKAGVAYSLVSRHPEDVKGFGELEIMNYDEASNVISSHFLVINATPLGTWPKIEDCPPLDLGKVGTNHIFYDLIYNPMESILLKRAKARGAQIFNGYQMLINQALLSWEFWNA